MILQWYNDTTVCTQGLNFRRGMQSSRYCPPIPWVDHHHHHHNQPHHSNHHHLHPIMPGCTLHILLGQHCLHMVQAGESWKFQKFSHLIIITIKFTSIATQSHHHRHQSPHYRFFKSHNITKPLPQHLNHGGTSNAWKWVQPNAPKLNFFGDKQIVLYCIRYLIWLTNWDACLLGAALLLDTLIVLLLAGGRLEISWWLIG